MSTQDNKNQSQMNDKMGLSIVSLFFYCFSCLILISLILTLLGYPAMTVGGPPSYYDHRYSYQHYPPYGRPPYGHPPPVRPAYELKTPIGTFSHQ